MVNCPKCSAKNPDHARTCAVCGCVIPVKIVTMEDVLKSRAPKPAEQDNSSVRAAGPGSGGMSADDRAQLEKQLVYEREKRERAEEAIENLKNAAAERDSAAERIQINLGRYQKYINKTTLYAALGVVLAGFILIIVGFSGRAGMKKKIAEFRPYKDWYDSVSVVSRRAAAERDSLRTELTGLQVRHAAALAEQETLAAAAVQGRANRVDGTAQIRKVDVSIEMVAVQGGTFNMGCTSEQGNDCNDNEKPARSVAVGSFSIGRYPVTQGQWMQVMGSNPSHYRGGNDMPVERVSWRDAQEFITKLNQMTGKRYRLPTEAEWEYAARGGARNRGYKFSGSNHIEEVAWYARTSGTARVGTRKPNELRIFDMSGNVSEWVNDRYGNYDHVPAGDYRVLRGGSWSSVAKSCRVASRAGMPPGTRGNNIGFRLAQ